MQIRVGDDDAAKEAFPAWRRLALAGGIANGCCRADRSPADALPTTRTIAGRSPGLAMR